jgi:hypothetical protein
VWVAGLLAIAFVAMTMTRGGNGVGRGPGSARVAPLMLLPDEIAQPAVGGGNPVRVSPPIDVVEAERWASRIPLLDVPLPSERQVETWRLAGGIEITQAVLYYADPAEGARLESVAGTLLSTGLGLQSRPLALAGADSALRWDGAGFVGASFRRGRFVVLVGVTGPAPSGAAEALAERVLAKVETALDVTAPATAPTPPAGAPGAP